MEQEKMALQERLSAAMASRRKLQKAVEQEKEDLSRWEEDLMDLAATLRRREREVEEREKAVRSKGDELKRVNTARGTASVSATAQSLAA